ncbi:MAG TPA: hybrid sensor histidine kinase/response regulator [Actinomycetota bacterium]
MVRSVLLCDTPGAISALHAATRHRPDLVVDVSTDALRAIEAAARIRPDVICCRLAIDGFTDLELLTRFLSASPTSAMVVRLSLDDLGLASMCLRTGARGVVATDDDPATCLEVITAVAERPTTVALSTRMAFEVGVTLGDRLAETGHMRIELEGLRESISQGTTAKADFLSNISHELRTPVTVAKGIAYVLRNPSVGEDERAEFLDTLQDSLDNLMGLVDEIITMSELERGTFELDLADIDLAPIVQRSIGRARGRHEAVRIEASIAPSLPAHADADRVEGVVDELLENACRYSPANEPVEITARLRSEGVVVSVTDHGEGLARTVARRSFEEPFSTGEGVLRKEKAGVGVGLHLARQLIIEHGGTLWTDPLPGGGTRASFCIPVPDRDRGTHAGLDSTPHTDP